MKEDSESVEDYPNICVIIPLYNEGIGIQKTLQSIVSQNYPPNALEVIVVDDCSTDNSYDVACGFLSQMSYLRVIKNPVNLGKRLGIASAVKQTQAPYIISVDSDVELLPGALVQLMSQFTSPRVVAVGGQVLVSNATQNWLTGLQSIKYFLAYRFLKNIENRFKSVLCLSGCLTAYRRAALEEVDPILKDRNLFGIPIKYGEDRFLTRQLLKLGYQTVLNLDARCATKAPHRLSGYFSQQIRWRRSNIVDVMGGVFHLWKLNPFVSLHYFSLHAMLMCYPIFLWTVFLRESFFWGVFFHLGVLALYGLVYGVCTCNWEPKHRANPLCALGLGLLLPVSYLALSLLALFTIDSGSWETRGHKGHSILKPTIR